MTLVDEAIEAPQRQRLILFCLLRQVIRPLAGTGVPDFYGADGTAADRDRGRAGRTFRVYRCDAS